MVGKEDEQQSNGTGSRSKMQKTQSVDSTGSSGDKEDKAKYEVGLVSLVGWLVTFNDIHCCCLERRGFSIRPTEPAAQLLYCNVFPKL